MSIEKLRHGSEITSAKLNEIIDVINNTNNEHQTIRDLGESIKGTVKEVYNTLEKYSEQVGEHLDSIPEIKNLYADILLARDSVDWIDLAEDETDVTAFIAAALEGSATDQPAERLKVIRGTTHQITLNTPEVKDKQILIAYDENSNRGIMYFDIGNRRIPVSASWDVTITAKVPTFKFETRSTGEVICKVEVEGNPVVESTDLRGPAGTPGAQGPQGIKGEKGERGEQGLQGIQGTKGQDGATTKLAIFFSDRSDGYNSTETYNNHKYMGIKTYLSTDDDATYYSRPIKWFRISGDTMYPHYENGYLTFSTTAPEQGVTSFYIKGEKGDTGATGEAPTIVFVKDGEEVSITPNIDEQGRYVYDASLFQGPQGIAGIRGAQGEQGKTGPAPVIAFKAEATTDEQPSVENTTPVGSSYDAVFTLKIPKGKDGSSVQKAYTLATGEVLLSKDDGSEISLGILKGDKGDKGDPATIAIKGAVSSTSELPLNNLTSGDAYVVTSIVDDATISELYICVDPVAETFEQVYKNLGNIKGEKGDTGTDGKDGSTLYTGADIDRAGVDIVINKTFKEGDYYLNTNELSQSCGNLYRIQRAEGTTYTIALTGSLKGPQGDKGERGEQGAEGRGITKIEKTSSIDTVDTYTITYSDNSTSPINITNGKDGVSGADGTKIYNGSSEPNTDLGVIGDFYINTLTGDLYKKQTMTSWGTSLITLKGTNGLNGIDGKDGIRGPQMSIYETLPTAENHITGDIVLLSSTFALYELRNNNEGIPTWTRIGGDSFTIIGPQGSQGVQGEKGDTGSYVMATKIEDSTQAVSLVMQQSVYYELTNPSITAISLSLGEIADNTVGEFTVEFTINTGNSIPTITLPNNVLYANNWSDSDYEPGHRYVIYILNNFAYVSFREV